ncbi:MAG: bifunctional (p)ppGpp synthetase/guanosine-3',5'-bis(diphosphate) 3'-pyrophosphohydrolase [Bacteroidales bacterium]|nr:bifunctional (p)ppGpp synthetase/guanosine-3',5'-bis(diphosphate) 3'-pyrophosphohydrolase [Bacteroidales bacterium]
MLPKINFDKKTEGKITDRERKKIINKYRELLKLSENFTNKKELELIRKAFDITLNAYEEKRIASGSPYILEVLETASLVVEQIGLGTRSVVATLLYQAVIDHKITLDEVEKEFDKAIALIVDGLVKISDINTKTEATQAENFRQMLLTLAEDVRVILIKLAILLQDMRGLNYMPEEYQIKTSLETFSLYAPLAHRLGLYNIKSELENLSLKYTEKEVYKEIIKKLKNTTAKRERFIKKFLAPIEKELNEQGFDYEIKGRPKSVYSIWQKMKKQGVEFEEVYDIFAIRIILNSKPSKEKSDCWRTYSVVTDFYQPNPKRLRDWISIPKTNGYESLHTTVVGQEGKWVEVQIRTKRMDEVAEKGYAAHWRYKGVKAEKGIDSWMQKVRDVIESNNTSTAESIDDLKLNLYNKEVFVFTPTGDLRKLPAGATVLDFAYDVHSDVGNKCVGARINHKNVTIKQALQNGDQIEIITSKSQKPKTDWLNFVVTSKAITKIKSTLKEEKYKEAEAGKELLKRRLKNWKIKFDDHLILKILKHYKLKVPVDLYYALATEKIEITDIKELLTEKKSEDKEQLNNTEKKSEQVEKEEESSSSSGNYLIIDNNIENIDYKLAKCCSPIFGDSIFGFVTVSEGIKIHRTNCPNARQLVERYNYRIIKAQWTKSALHKSFQATIKVTGIDEMGMLSKISDIISKDLKVSVRSITMDSSDGMFDGNIKLSIDSTKHLEMLMAKLKKEKSVLKVTRVDSSEN